MRKLAVLIACLFAVALSACSTDQQSTTAAPNADTDPTLVPTTIIDPTVVPSTGNGSTVEGNGITLMIYMVGSDLEAKTAAGTSDLEEIQNSGVDLSRNNVIICTGGAAKWHNDMTSADSLNYLQLTEEGYRVLCSLPAASMGQQSCLADFLCYGYTEFPADDFALILWDHGNGPVIGYGKDMLFDNDTLTLGEMGQALEASPFGPENKLAWVGFDACLMASAELATVWADYAAYLVASQEIEPSFGWDYAFLQSLGTADTPELLTGLTRQYLEICQAYYEKKGYDDRDTTLSCIDLSLADDMEAAINDLFARAAADVGTKYSILTAKRVQTRALGRASTGSEYDLIDLKDLAAQMLELYPQEATRLQETVDAMVVANATNAQECCGLSLYYPFYNKTYFENDWQTVYQQLGLFTEYQAYLSAYAQVWLGNDMLQNTESLMPNIVSKGVYSLELTPEQAENFAEARYYILQQHGEELFLKLYSGSNITREGNTLIAGFDGNILYVKNKYNDYGIPDIAEYDTVGDVTRYGVYVNVTNENADLFYEEEGYQRVTLPSLFHLTVNRVTGQLSMAGLTQWVATVTEDILIGGKLEEVDLTGMSRLYFARDTFRYMTRYENGTIKPVHQWPSSGALNAYVFAAEDEIRFEYAPLENGRYFIIFEITDTQGNSYCSEPIAIEAGGEVEPPIYPDPVQINWDSGEEVVIYQDDKITAWITPVEEYDIFGDLEGIWYGLKVRNDYDFPVCVMLDDVYWNGDLYDSDGGSYMIIPAHSTGYGNSSDSIYSARSIPMGDAAYYLAGAPVENMRFTLEIVNSNTYKTLVRKQQIDLHIGEACSLPAPQEEATYTQPYRGILAQEQVVFESEQMRITLLGLGRDEWGSRLTGVVCVENCTDETIFVQVQGLILDGVYLPLQEWSLEVPAYSRACTHVTVFSDYLEDNDVTSAATAQLQIRYVEGMVTTGFGGFSELGWYDVQLKDPGEPISFVEGETVLFDEYGVRVSLLYFKETYGTPQWYLAIVNDSDIPIALDLTDSAINAIFIGDEYYGQAIYDGRVGPGQKTVCYLAVYQDVKVTKFSFRFRILDFGEEKVLYDGQQIVTLYPPN